jgi:hypothetical protein
MFELAEEISIQYSTHVVYICADLSPQPFNNTAGMNSYLLITPYGEQVCTRYVLTPPRAGASA